MKKLLFLPMLLLFLNVYSQTFQEAYQGTRQIQPTNDIENASTYLNGSAIQTKWSKIWGVSFQFDDIQLEKDGIEGTVYLFDSWKNNAVLVMNKKKYMFSNINLHINRDEFMSQIKGDSTFVFNLNNIYANNKEYTSVYNINENKKKVYEVVHGGEKLSILKGYSLKFVGASPNPMVLRKTNKIKRVKKYFSLKDGKVYPLNLKRSKILALLDFDKRDKVKKFAKKNKLSFKNEKFSSFMKS